MVETIYCHTDSESVFQTKSFLKQNAESRATSSGVSLAPVSHVTSQLPASGTKMTPDELEKVSRDSFWELV